MTATKADGQGARSSAQEGVKMSSTAGRPRLLTSQLQQLRLFTVRGFDDALTKLPSQAQLGYRDNLFKKLQICTKHPVT